MLLMDINGKRMVRGLIVTEKETKILIKIKDFLDSNTYYDKSIIKRLTLTQEL